MKVLLTVAVFPEGAESADGAVGVPFPTIAIVDGLLYDMGGKMMCDSSSDLYTDIGL